MGAKSPPLEILDAKTGKRITVIEATSAKSASKSFFKQAEHKYVNEIRVRPTNHFNDSGELFARKGGPNIKRVASTPKTKAKAKVSNKPKKERSMQIFNERAHQPNERKSGVAAHMPEVDRQFGGQDPKAMYRVAAPHVVYNNRTISRPSLEAAKKHLVCLDSTPGGAAEQFAEMLPEWNILLVRRCINVVDQLIITNPRTISWKTFHWLGYEINRHPVTKEVVDIRLLPIDSNGMQTYAGDGSAMMKLDGEDYMAVDLDQERLERLRLVQQQEDERKAAEQREAEEREAREKAQEAALSAMFGPVVHHQGPVV